MQYIRSKLFDVLWAIWTIVFSPSIPVLMLFGSPPKYVRLISRIWVRGSLLILKYVVGLTYSERGRENMPTQPCLIVSNHQSPWETLAHVILFPEVAVVTKKELGRIPIFGWFLRKSPMIMIDRSAGSQAMQQMVQQGLEAIGEGRSVLIFPEGTRKRVSEKINFKRGVELLYATLKIPTLPVALNSGLFWGRDQQIKCNGKITVSYLPVIAPGLSPSEFKRIGEQILDDEKARLVGEFSSLG